MTHVFTRPFRVRIYELDSLGQVRNAVYLHYCEQAAMEAAESLGYTLEYHRKLGWIWVVRRTILEYVAPARYGDIVNVTTWLSRLTHVSAYREYLLTRESDGAVLGRVQSRWVLLSTRTGRPVRLPREMAQIFQPNGKTVVRELMPMQGEESVENPRHYTHRRKVQRYELDSAGHVNNAVYLNWLEQAEQEAMAQAGFPASRLRERGITVAQTRIELEYLRPAREGDEIEIDSHLAAIASSHGTWAHQIRRAGGGALLARAWSTNAFLTSDGHSTRAPASLLQALIQRP